MSIFKKDNIKSVIVLCVVSTIIAMIIMGFLSYFQYKEYKYEINKYMSATIQKIIKLHPEIEDEIMGNFENYTQEDFKEGVRLFRKYGFQKETIFFTEIEEQMNENINLNIFTIGILGILFLAIFITYIIVKDKKIHEITEYLERIENKDYSLKIEENTEGELSQLRNKIYKITVMLREGTDRLSADKNSLANSISDISHQLKTPLTSIGVMLDVLKDNENVPNDKKKEFLFEISRQLDWINWLVISLLKISRIDAGVVEFKKDTINVSDVIENVVKNLSIPIDIKNQNIVIKGESDVSFIGDFNWTVEAITNIVKNCLEHSKQNKKLEIQYSENPLYTHIHIRDEGSGIAKEDLPHVFERFYKGINSSKDSVGIGLALSQSIVSRQGGDVIVRSEENVGSVFDIKFFRL